MMLQYQHLCCIYDNTLLLMSKFSEVIIEVQTDGWSEEVTIYPTKVQFLIFIRNPIFTQSFTHVQIDTVVLPGVAGCMRVVAQVTLQNLI